MAVISFGAAIKLHQGGRLDEAEQAYRGILATEPDHAGALHLLGVIRDQQGLREEALELIGRAIAANPAKAGYHNNYGAALLSLERNADAEVSFRRALAICPNYADALANLGLALSVCEETENRPSPPAPLPAGEGRIAPSLFASLSMAEVSEACFRRALQCQPVYVSYHTSNGTALAGSDYVAQTGTVVFAANTTYLTKTITVSTQYNALNTKGRDFSLALSPGPTYLIAVGVGDGRINVLPAGKLTIYYGDGTTIPADKQNTVGALLFTELESNVARMGISAQLPAGASGNFYLVNHSSKIAIYTDAACQTPINYNQPAPSVVYVKATGVASGAIAAEKVDLVYRVSGMADITRDTAAFTAVSVKLKAAQFTSDFQDARSANIVRHTTSFADEGKPNGCDDFTWPADSLYASQTTAIAQRVKTKLALDATVQISPAGINCGLKTNDSDNRYGPLFDMSGGIITSNGAAQDVGIHAADNDLLPDGIVDISPQFLAWKVTLPLWGATALVGTSQAEVFVTYDKPSQDWSFSTRTAADPNPFAPNIITDKRLSLATALCVGVSDVFVAAKKVQEGLPSIAVNWNPSGPNFPNSTDELWDLAAGHTSTFVAGCNNYALLEELILGQLGIKAKTEMVLPTPVISNGQLAPQGQVRLFSATSKYLPFKMQGPDGTYTLLFNFDNKPNNWEGGVLVQDQGSVQPGRPAEFFTQGQSAQDRVVGVANVTKGVNVWAEYDAILNLAWKYFENAGQLQQPHKDDPGAFDPRLGYFPFPGPYPDKKRN